MEVETLMELEGLESAAGKILKNNLFFLCESVVILLTCDTPEEDNRHT